MRGLDDDDSDNLDGSMEMFGPRECPNSLH